MKQHNITTQVFFLSAAVKGARLQANYASISPSPFPFLKSALLFLATKAVKGAALFLEGVHHVKGRDGLSAGVLGVGDGVPDDVLKKNLDHPAGLLVNQARQALDTAATGQTTNSWLGNSLNVIPQDFPVPLRTAFAEALSAFAASRHDSCNGSREVFDEILEFPFVQFGFATLQVAKLVFVYIFLSALSRRLCYKHACCDLSF